MKIAFYFVNEDYINFLKEKEIYHRGFTTVPNVVYSNREKFLYGTVLEVGEINYLVPVSSYARKQQDNFLIKVSDHGKEKIVGSLRFNYMIPVPRKFLHVFNFKKEIDNQERRVLVEKEYRFCRKHLATIRKRAKKTYDRVVNKVDQKLVKNSCDFPLLEKAYKDCIQENSLFVVERTMVN